MALAKLFEAEIWIDSIRQANGRWSMNRWHESIVSAIETERLADATDYTNERETIGR